MMSSSTESGRFTMSSEEVRAVSDLVIRRIEEHKNGLATAETLQARFARYLSQILYPVLSLPFEVTSSIFIHCIPADGRVSPSSCAAPLILAQICRQWRDVALSTPILWCSLYIDGGMDINTLTYRPTVPNDTRVQNLIRTWYSRAGSSRLSFGLNFRFRQASKNLLRLIASYSGQIERLELHVWQPQLETAKPFAASFPVLQYLSITNSFGADVQSCLAATASTLRELRLLETQNIIPSFPYSLPLLTRLEISANISPQTLLQILHNCPSLSHLFFSISEFEARSIPEPSTATTEVESFPNISSVILASPDAAVALRLVTFPNLHTIEIQGFTEPDEMRTFISRSGCAIRHLVIFLSGCDDDQHADEDTNDTADWLAIFPHLEVLKIKECPNPERLIDALDSSSLVPHLKDISIRSCITRSTIDNNYDDSLLEMLHKRIRMTRDSAVSGGGGLRKFHITFSIFHADQEDEENRIWFPGYLATAALNRLVEGGLDFMMRVESSVSGTHIWPKTYREDKLVDFP
ncbi:F-box domain-containing protein, partial [Favolaschia claudopus]